MTTIDEIMAAATDFGDARMMARIGLIDLDSVRERHADLRALITLAIAEARADGFRDGAEAMREELATACGSTFTTISGREEVERLHFDDEKISAAEIRDWPLCATAKREPVRLTDAEIVAPVVDGFGAATNDWASHIEFARAIETAVLAANGLTK